VSGHAERGSRKRGEGDYRENGGKTKKEGRGPVSIASSLLTPPPARRREGKGGVLKGERNKASSIASRIPCSPLGLTSKKKKGERKNQGRGRKGMPLYLSLV